MQKKDIIVFNDDSLSIEVNVSPDQDTVWLNRLQIAELFDRDVKTIGKHINNVLSEELYGDDAVVAIFATTAKDGKTYEVEHYNLDVIISVGYRVKSKRGIQFRKWASSILKEYFISGFVLDEERFSINAYGLILETLTKHRNTSVSSIIEGERLLDFLNAYQYALVMLDNYDHHRQTSPTGSQDTYHISYHECLDLISKSTFKDKGDLFAQLKDQQLFSSSIETIYQTYDEIELYPTLEMKASNLLYFITKNHAFADGNKRIAATIFIYFLDKNNALLYKGALRISNSTLATLTILIAASDPNEKENIIDLILILLK